MIKFRNLRPDDIEVRLQSVAKNDKGVILLLYKNARVDMNILDDTLGQEGWSREHYQVKDTMFCRVGIKTPNDWVYKSDCGTESYSEAQKGEASDSFKRACFNWGIGRELYTAPFIFIPADRCNIENGKCFDRFSVEKIRIDRKKITGLCIRNDTMNCRCFVWTQKTPEKGGGESGSDT